MKQLAFLVLLLASITTGCVPGNNVRTVKKIVTYEGIQVSGKNTYVQASYWAKQLNSLGKLQTFQLFHNRYKQLVANNTGVEYYAYSSFKSFCKAQKLSLDFDAYWQLNVTA